MSQDVKLKKLTEITTFQLKNGFNNPDHYSKCKMYLFRYKIKLYYLNVIK